jgi:hypothetical protein
MRLASVTLVATEKQNLAILILSVIEADMTPQDGNVSELWLADFQAVVLPAGN